MSVDEQAEQRRAGQPGQGFALLGRPTERAAIDRVLDAVRGGLSGTLVLRGEPGVGETTLLRYAIEAAPDLRVSHIAGVESEISMEFGGLHQLLLPFLPLLDDLPPPQCRALRVAFGQQTGPPPEQFLVGLAALTLLSRAAQDQPLLCAIDDAHRLDHESALVLGFVARRLYADRVAIIATSDELVPSPTAEGLPAIAVSGLPDAAARDLLAVVSGGVLNAQAVDRILADTRNNPLALVELGTEYTADQLSARAALPEPLPLGQRLRKHFLRRVRGLAPDAQVFTLLAAADPGGERGRLWRAAVRAGIDPEMASAETAWAGVLQFPGESVRFRYPLLRSAVYHGANAADRRRAHRILAGAAQALAHDDRLARDTMFGALEAAMWCGPELTREIARLARALPPVSGVAPSASDLLLEGYSARFTLGYQASVRPLRAAVSALLADDLDSATGLRCFAHGAVAAGSLWDDQATLDLLDRWVAATRATGALTTLPVALSYHATSNATAGRLREADASWAAMLEVLTLSHGLGALGSKSRRNGLVLAYRGNLAEARAMGLDLVGESAGGGRGRVADVGAYIAAVADSFNGNYAAAIARALTVVANDHAYTVERVLPELVEAALRVGQPEVAATAYDTLSQRALAAGTPWGLGLRARCAALLAEGPAAEDCYREAISQLERCRMAVDLARAHLLYGQWTPTTLTTLTPQESRIADLTADGASNSEIAAQLFIRPSTVDYHLRKVFRKLNVTSRTQLADQLKSRQDAGRRRSRG